jgi:glutathione S-transferase
MKIYETKTAPNPRRVRIFLAEKGITVPFEQVEFTDTALKSAEFSKLNPLQRVPVLVLDDGTAISESVAICRYFEELHPEPALFGKGAKERAEVEMWQRRMEMHVLFPIAQAFRHAHPAMAKFEVPQLPAWAEANKPRALEGLGVLDRQLAGSPYVAGPNYSIADITALCAVDFMRPARIQLPPEMTNIARWHAEVSARPSAKA